MTCHPPARFFQHLARPTLILLTSQSTVTGTMDLTVGRRISLGSHHGTIRYRGPVPPSTGEWLGIEWDDPTRGKHDGTSADGTHYFHVRTPGSASFIRPTASKLSCGCSFLEALRNKYLPPSQQAQTQTGLKDGEGQQQYSRKTIADIEIEAPNLDRIAKRAARLDRLKEVGLGGWQQLDYSLDATTRTSYNVARAFDREKGFGEGTIRETCPNIRWLDLSRSLLPDWEEVSLIAGELEYLYTLLLQFNRLQSPPHPIPASWVQRMGHIQDLRLDGTLIQWHEVLRLAPALFGLKHLQLGSNGLASLDSPHGEAGVPEGKAAAVLPSLTSLSLEDNQLSSWSKLVSALAPLPSLESLVLNHNHLSLIPPASTSSPRLSRLKELHLQDNKLESWSSLEHISQWLGHERGLEALHISSIQEKDEGLSVPSKSGEGCLLDRYEYRDFRAITIARLPHLKVLDRTEVTAKELKDAELFVYTRFRQGDESIIHGTSISSGSHSDVRDALELSAEEKIALFPRYVELAKRFDGESEGVPQEVVKQQKHTLRAKMLSLRVLASEKAPSLQKPHVEAPKADVKVQILASTPLRLAKIKLANAVGVKAGQIAQVWALLRQSRGEENDSGEDAKEERIVLEVDDMSRSLDWYEVSAGDQLVLVTEG